MNPTRLIRFVAVALATFGVVASAFTVQPWENPVSPVEVPPLAVIWNDLFSPQFVEGEHGLFIREDISITTEFGEGAKLVVLGLDSEGEYIEENIGASFVEYTTYPAVWHDTVSFLLVGTHQGNPVAVNASVNIDIVVGRIINADGAHRIVAAFSYVADFAGVGTLQDGGVTVKHLVPFYRAASLQAADDKAYYMSATDLVNDGRANIDVVNCEQFEDYCEREYCYCRNEHQIAYYGALALCDGFQDLGVSVAACAASGAAGGAVGGLVGARRGGPKGTIIGTVFGGCVGVVTGFFVSENIQQSACRQRAETRRQTDKNFANNALAACRGSVPPSFVCPDSRQTP